MKPSRRTLPVPSNPCYHLHPDLPLLALAQGGPDAEPIGPSGNFAARGGGLQGATGRPVTRRLGKAQRLRWLDGGRRGSPPGGTGLCPERQPRAAGDSSPPAGAAPVTEHDEDQFARNIFQRAFSTRDEAGDRLQEVLFQRLDESVDVFTGIEGDQWDNPCYWPPGPEPVRTMLDMRISELTMHAWDICSRFDPDYRLSDGSVSVLLDTVNRAARRAFRPDPTIPAPQVYRFNIDKPVEASFELVIANEEVILRQGSGDEEANVEFICNGETYVMVMYGRITPDEAIVTGDLDWEGDERLALGFGARFLGG